MAELKNTVINDVEFLDLPTGTTNQRPGTAEQGMIRFNTTEGYVEGFDGSEWVQLGLTGLEATGGSVSDVTIGGEDYRIHSFTSTGTSTFTVNSLGSTNGEADVLVVAGGGGGGDSNSAGGGGGGVVLDTVLLENGSYTINVGDGASGGPRFPNNSGRDQPFWPDGKRGGNTTAFGLTAIGGGNGGGDDSWGSPGGSGGGGADDPSEAGPGPTEQNNQGSPGFGFRGGDGRIGGNGAAGAGGGGADGPGFANSGSNARDGGPGKDFSSTFGTSFGENGYFAGGGGGGLKSNNNLGGQGGIGGGADGNANNSGNGGNGTNGTGGGGGGANNNGGAGGSGIVLIRYRIS